MFIKLSKLSTTNTSKGISSKPPKSFGTITSNSSIAVISTIPKSIVVGRLTSLLNSACWKSSIAVSTSWSICSNKSIPGKYDKLNPNESSGAANVDSDSKFYGSNNPSDPNAPIPKLPDGPFNPNALELTRPQNNYTARDMIKNKSISKAPPPPGTTSVEQFIENMNLSFRF